MQGTCAVLVHPRTFSKVPVKAEFSVALTGVSLLSELRMVKNKLKNHGKAAEGDSLELLLNQEEIVLKPRVHFCGTWRSVEEQGSRTETFVLEERRHTPVPGSVWGWMEMKTQQD